MRPHEKLEVWKRAIEFVVRIYKLTEGFPREEKFGLTSLIKESGRLGPCEYSRRYRTPVVQRIWLLLVECAGVCE